MYFKKTRFLTFLSFFISILITGIGIQKASAQNDHSDHSHLGAVTTFDIQVNNVPKFEKLSKKMVEVRTKANLTSEFAYGMYMSNWDYLIFSPISSMAELDSNKVQQAIKGTAGEEVMKSISFEGLDAVAKTEVVEMKPEWSYIPENAPQMGHYIEVQEHWVLPASYSSKEYTSVIQEIKDFFSKIEYPIRVDAYEYRIGESRYAFVFQYNDRGAYLTEFAPRVLLQKHPEFQEIVNRLNSHLIDFKQREWTLLPNLSFLPDQS